MKQGRFSQYWFIVFLITVFAFAIPTKINYQGKLTEGGAPVNGTRTMQFYVDDNSSTGDGVVWDSGVLSVGVINGIYNVSLPIEANVFESGSQLKLRVKVDAQELAPDIELLAVPYAYIAATANSSYVALTSNYTYLAETANFASSAENANNAYIASTSNYTYLAATANSASIAENANNAYIASTSNYTYLAATANNILGVSIKNDSVSVTLNY